jgi:hypothetical protein
VRCLHKTAVLLIGALAVLSLAACAKKTDTDRVRAVINAVQQAAEDRDVKETLSHVDRNYRDPAGNDYQAVKGMMLYYFFRHQKISIIVSNLETVVDGASASAHFQAILSGRTGSAADILPDALSAYRFDVSFRNDQGDWKIISARWEPWGDAVQDAVPNR